jgi:hypothetical protein
MLSRRLMSTTLTMSSRKAANASQIPLQAKGQVEQTKHEAGPSSAKRRTPLTVDSLRYVRPEDAPYLPAARLPARPLAGRSSRLVEAAAVSMSTPELTPCALLSDRPLARARALARPSVLEVEYAVRGAVPQKAATYADKLAKGEKLPFDKIVYANIGTPQQKGLDQKPITWWRQVRRVTRVLIAPRILSLIRP